MIPKTDGDKLRMLAKMFDVAIPDDKNREIQEDLHRIAKRLDDMDQRKEK